MMKREYSKPSDVVPITDYLTTLQNAVLWAKWRDIDQMEFNMAGLQYNVATETEEGAIARVAMMKAHKEGNQEEAVKQLCEYVDSLADMLIFVLVDTIKVNAPKPQINHNEVDMWDVPERAAITDPISPMWFYGNSSYLYYTCIVRDIYTLGFHPDRVLEEAFKEVSTRRGAYSEVEGKWLKEPTPESEQYKANYMSCILEQDEAYFNQLVSINGFKSSDDDEEEKSNIITPN